MCLMTGTGEWGETCLRTEFDGPTWNGVGPVTVCQYLDAWRVAQRTGGVRHFGVVLVAQGLPGVAAVGLVQVVSGGAPVGWLPA